MILIGCLVEIGIAAIAIFVFGLDPLLVILGLILLTIVGWLVVFFETLRRAG